MFSNSFGVNRSQPFHFPEEACGKEVRRAWETYNGDIQKVTTHILEENKINNVETSPYLYRIFAYEQLNLDEQQSATNAQQGMFERGLRHRIPKLDECKELVSKVATAGAQRVCSVAFRPGDIVWNCKQCQKDDTCVLCQKCFSNSNHEGHDIFFYQVMTTAGGCCDCGDPDAWDAQGFCSEHGDNVEQGEPEEALPESMVSSSRILFDTLVDYLVHNSKLRPTHLTLEFVPGKTFEEYDQLVSQEFSDLYSKSWSERLKDWYACNSTVQFARTSLFLTDSDLEVSPQVLESDLVKVNYKSGASESQILQIITWLLEVCQTSDAISRILCKALTETQTPETQLQLSASGSSFSGTLLGTTSQGSSTTNLNFGYLGALLINDVYLPEAVSVALHRLYMRLLVDGLFKERYAIAFAKTYCEVCRKFVALPPANSNQNENTIFGLSVQFLNRSTFVETLVFEHNLLESLIKSLVMTLASAWDSSSLTSLAAPFPRFAAVRTLHDVVISRKYSHIMTDLRYVLQIPGISRYLCLYQPRLFQQWCLALACAQGVDQQVRQTCQHVEYTSEAWVNAFNLNLSLTSIFPYLLQWLHDKDLGMSSCLTVQLGNTENSRGHMSQDHAHALVRLVGHGAHNLCNWLETKHPVGTSFECLSEPPNSRLGEHWVMGTKESSVMSFHVPLHRFFGFLMRAGVCSTLDEQVYAQLMGMGSTAMWVGVCQFPLQCLVFAAEIQTGMWRRNGSSMDNQLVNYCMVPLCRHSRDLDHVLLQLAALNLQVNHFVSCLLHSFRVRDYFFADTNVGQQGGAPSGQWPASEAFESEQDALSGRPPRASAQNLRLYPQDRNNGTQVLRTNPIQSPASVPGVSPPVPEMTLGSSTTSNQLPNEQQSTQFDIRIQKNSRLVPLVESLLSLVIVVVTELPVPSKVALERQAAVSGNADSNEKDSLVALVQLRREVVHKLATQPCAFSGLLECCYNVTTHGSVDASDEELKLVLNEVAELKESPDGMAAAKYRLLDEGWKLYDPFYYHLIQEAHEKAREQWLTKRLRLYKDSSGLLSSKKGYFPGDVLRSAKSFLEYVPSPAVPPPPTAHPAFLPLREKLLFGEGFFGLMRIILLRTVHSLQEPSPRRPRSASMTDAKPQVNEPRQMRTERIPPTLLAIVLHLLTLQIHCLPANAVMTGDDGAAAAQESASTTEGDASKAEAGSPGRYEWSKNSPQETYTGATLPMLCALWWKPSKDTLSGVELCVFECLRDIWQGNASLEPGNRESLRWILMKMSKIDSKFNKLLSKACRSKSKSSKSSLDKASRKRKAQLRVLDHLRRQQQQAMTAFAAQFEEMSDDEDQLMQDANKLNADATDNPMGETGSLQGRPRRKSSSAGTISGIEHPSGTPVCVSCREHVPDLPIGHIAFAQRSSMLTGDCPENLVRWGTTHGRLMIHQCGHAIHFSCWTNYCSFLLNTENNLVVDLVEQLEFLCPLCKSISNMIVPFISTDMQEVTNTGDYATDRQPGLSREDDMVAIKRACSWLVDTDGFEMSSFKEMFQDLNDLGLGGADSLSTPPQPSEPMDDSQASQLRSILQQVALVLYDTDRGQRQSVAEFLFQQSRAGGSSDPRPQAHFKKKWAQKLAKQPEWMLCLWHAVAYTLMSFQVAETKAVGHAGSVKSDRLLQLLRAAQAVPTGSLNPSLFYKFVIDRLNRCLNPIYDLNRPPVVYDVTDQLVQQGASMEEEAQPRDQMQRLFALSAPKVGHLVAAALSNGVSPNPSGNHAHSTGSNVMSFAQALGGGQSAEIPADSTTRSNKVIPDMNWFVQQPALCTSPVLLLTLIALCKREVSHNLVVVLFALQLLQALIDPADLGERVHNRLEVDVRSIDEPSRAADDDQLLLGEMTDAEVAAEATALLAIRSHVLRVLHEHRRVRTDSSHHREETAPPVAEGGMHVGGIGGEASGADPMCVLRARQLWRTPRDMVRNVRQNVLPYLHVVVLLLNAYQAESTPLATATFASLAARLRVPRPASMAENPFLMELVKGWAARSASFIFTQTCLFEPAPAHPLSLPSRRARHALRPLHLVPLPRSYTELYAVLHAGTCPVCHQAAHDRAICLVCGKVLMAGGACTRRLGKTEGECSSHVSSEHGGVGVVFLLQRCNVLLVRGPRAAYWPSLYVDRHGEEHKGTSRGLPMFLDRNRYDRVEQLWLSHQIPKEITLKRNRAQAVIRTNYY